MRGPPWRRGEQGRVPGTQKPPPLCGGPAKEQSGGAGAGVALRMLVGLRWARVLGGEVVILGGSQWGGQRPRGAPCFGAHRPSLQEAPHLPLISSAYTRPRPVPVALWEPLAPEKCPSVTSLGLRVGLQLLRGGGRSPRLPYRGCKGKVDLPREDRSLLPVSPGTQVAPERSSAWPGSAPRREHLTSATRRGSDEHGTPVRSPGRGTERGGLRCVLVRSRLGRCQRPRGAAPGPACGSRCCPVGFVPQPRVDYPHSFKATAPGTGQTTQLCAQEGRARACSCPGSVASAFPPPLLFSLGGCTVLEGPESCLLGSDLTMSWGFWPPAW